MPTIGQDVTIPITEKRPLIRVQPTDDGVRVMHIIFDGRDGSEKVHSFVLIPADITEEVGQLIINLGGIEDNQ